jgi:3-dehydrosphinganine reductase
MIRIDAMVKPVFYEKNVYIPGGSSGIGLAVAKKLARQGAHVMIFARNRERLEKAANEISNCRSTAAQRVDAKVLDVCDHMQVEDVMGNAVAGFGVPDILINMAGQAEPRYFENITADQFDRIIKVNLYGTWNTISVLFPHMKKKGGAIVNTSSIAGLIGVFGYADYSASKFAVVGLSESLRCEFAPLGIRVSVLCPPDTDTPLFEEENKIKPLETKALSGGAKVLSADQVADDLIKGMEKGKFLIIPGTEGKMIDIFRRFFPSLTASFLDKTVRKVQKSMRSGQK